MDSIFVLLIMSGQESVNLQSIKTRMNNMIFSRYAQDSENVTSWRLT